MTSASVDGLLLGDFMRTTRQSSARIAFVVLGARGSGKSTVLKRFLSGCEARSLSVGKLRPTQAEGTDTDPTVVYADYYSFTDTIWGDYAIGTHLPTNRCLVLDDLHVWVQLRRLNNKSYDILSSWPGHIVVSCITIDCLPPSIVKSFIVVEYPITPSLQAMVRRIREAHPTKSLKASVTLAQQAPKSLSSADLASYIAAASITASGVKGQGASAAIGIEAAAHAFEQAFKETVCHGGGSSSHRALPVLPPSLQAVHERICLLLGQHLAQFLDSDNTGAVSRLSSSTTGILLSGPSGSGKTLLTHALEASYPSVPFIRAGSHEFFAKYLGESEERLREFFRAARKQAPCVVILEDIDVLGQKRSEGVEGSSVAKRILTALLCELDGVEDSSGVLVIGTTSASYTIDGALLRQGRLETVLEISPLTLADTACLLDTKVDLIMSASASRTDLESRLVGQPFSHFGKEMRLLLESTFEAV